MILSRFVCSVLVLVGCQSRGYNSASQAKASTPLTEDVKIVSAEFAESIFNSLEITAEKVNAVGGSSEVKVVGDGLRCSKNRALVSGGEVKTSYSCFLLKDRWKNQGTGSYDGKIFGSSDAQFVEALYNALNVTEATDEFLKSKTIEKNQPNNEGGTQFNAITCSKPIPQDVPVPVRAACNITNAL